VKQNNEENIKKKLTLTGPTGEASWTERISLLQQAEVRNSGLPPSLLRRLVASFDRNI
jgi:hypothetical protein